MAAVVVLVTQVDSTSMALTVTGALHQMVVQGASEGHLAVAMEEGRVAMALQAAATVAATVVISSVKGPVGMTIVIQNDHDIRHALPVFFSSWRHPFI